VALNDVANLMLMNRSHSTYPRPSYALSIWTQKGEGGEAA
jgi:hypothetical protein